MKQPEDLEAFSHQYDLYGDLILRTLVRDKVHQDVPKDILDVWRNLSRTTRLADHFIDNTQGIGIRLAFEENTLQYLSGKADRFRSPYPALDDKAQKLKKDLGVLPRENQLRFIFGLEALFIATENTKTTLDPKIYRDLKRLEGQLTAGLFLLFLPPEITTNERYQKLERTVRLGTSFVISCVDGLIDMTGDYQNGEILIQPTIKNRLAMLSGIWHDGAAVWPEIPRYLPQSISLFIAEIKNRNKK